MPSNDLLGNVHAFVKLNAPEGACSAFVSYTRLFQVNVRFNDCSLGNVK